MRLKTRDTGSYVHAEVQFGPTVIDLGLLDTEERLQLAREFEQAVDELMSYDR